MNRIVATDGRETIIALEKLNPSVIAVDTETSQLKWYGQEVYGVSLCDGETTVYVDITTPVSQKLHLMSFFEETTLIIGHNLVFDSKALKNLGINIFNKEWYDTMVAEHLLDERSEKSLKKLAEQYLGETTIEWKEAVKQGIHSKQFHEYAMNDAEWTYKIFNTQREKLVNEGMVPLMKEIEMPFIKALAEMEMNGITVDTKRVKEKTLELGELVFNSKLKALETIGERASIQMGLDGTRNIHSKLDLDSPKQLRELLYDKLGLKPEQKTAKGVPSTNKASLEAHKGQHEVIDALLEHRKYTKLLNAFFSPLISHVDPDGRVRPSFNNTGTRTGRLSCSSPNLQQLPRPSEDPAKTRACFTAAEGYTMISCDYSGQEIRVLAHVSKDQTLIETLTKGKDLHLATANKFYKLNIPEEALYETSPEYKKYKEMYSTERSRAKTITFGIAYGKEAYGFALDFKTSEEEAQVMLNNYFEGFPGVYQAIQDSKKSVNYNGYVTSMTGRKRHFDALERGGQKYYAKASYREAFNFLIQGYSADMMRLATNKVRLVSKQHPEWDLKLLASVHDENVYEVKNEHKEQAKKAIKEAFETAVTLSVPVVSSIGEGKNYDEAK